jgi:hypothetical protein
MIIFIKISIVIKKRNKILHLYINKLNNLFN